VAERSGDTAFKPDIGLRIGATPQSGVALRFPPHSKEATAKYTRYANEGNLPHGVRGSLFNFN